MGDNFGEFDNTVYEGTCLWNWFLVDSNVEKESKAWKVEIF